MLLIVHVTGCTVNAPEALEDPTQPTPDCRDTTKACPAPFQCSVASTAADPSVYSCNTEHIAVTEGCKTRVETGFDQNDVLTVGYHYSKEDVIVHWQLNVGCIPVYYTSELQSKVPLISNALAAIKDIPGLQLCFGAPTLSNVDPIAKDSRATDHRGIFFGVDDAFIDDFDDNDSLNHFLSLATPRFERATGRIFSAKVSFRKKAIDMTHPEFDPSYADQATFSQHFATALGLIGTDRYDVAGRSVTFSLLNSDSRATFVTDADIAALQRLYGSNPLCGAETISGGTSR